MASFDNSNAVRYENTRLTDYSDDRTLHRSRMDLSLILLTMLLLIVGLVMVLSSSYASAYYSTVNSNGEGANATYQFLRQVMFALVGLAAMLMLSRLPVRVFRRWAYVALVVATVALALVLVFGKEVNNAKRWIQLGSSFRFQPSEIIKTAVILAFARLTVEQGPKKMRTFRYGILPFLVVLGIICLLLQREPHYSAIIIMLAIGLVMLFVGGVRLGWFAAAGVGGAGLLYIASQTVSYVKERIQAWQDPYSVASGAGYQIIQSLYAIGSGGLLGLGIGNSRQKYLYLPEESNDYIFSVVCEELGFIGALLIIALFMLLILRGYWVALHASDRFGMLVAVGITTKLALQVFLNIAVCTNFLPCTGISLPFFSYGGTALIMQLAEMGILLSISRDIPEKG